MAASGWSSTRAPARHPGWPARLGPLQVAGGVMELRKPRLRDGGAWSSVRMRDRHYLEAWEPSAPGTWGERNSSVAWISQWSALRSLARRGQSLPFVITLDGTFAGQITIGNVIRGSLCSAWVGYWVASDLAGGGVATAAVALVVDHCFQVSGLHRLEATVRPENAASLRVLTKLGFRHEGLFQRYLDVAGDWRDHHCLAVTAEEASGGMVAKLRADGRVDFA